MGSVPAAGELPSKLPWSVEDINRVLPAVGRVTLDLGDGISNDLPGNVTEPQFVSEFGGICVD